MSSSDESSTASAAQVSPPPSPSVILVTPARTSKAQTRSDSSKPTPLFVAADGDRPTVTDVSDYIVILDADITDLDGPIFGIIGEPVSVKSKGKSQRPGVYVRELFQGSIGETAWVVNKSGLEFITAARHAADMDHLLYRHGRIIDPLSNEICYGQVAQLNFDGVGTPNGLYICPRGLQGSEHWLRSNPWDFQLASSLEFMLNYGAGEKDGRHQVITRWGLAMSNRIGTATTLKTLIGYQKGRPSVDINFKDEVIFLSADGSPKTCSADEFLANEVFHCPYPPVVVRTKTKKAKKPIKVATIVKPAKKKASVPVTKALLYSSESDSDTISQPLTPPANGDSDSEASSQAIEDVTPTPEQLSSTAARAVLENKYGIRMSAFQLERHNAIFKKDLFRGKWMTMTLEARADRIYRSEMKRGVYDTTKTAVQSFLQGNLGSDPISYYMPFDKVPLSEKQSLPMEKWTLTVPPRRWVKTMKELDGCFHVVNEMAHLYLRVDVANAVSVLYKKVNYWSDTNFPVHAVNAYRDLYCGALAAVVDAAMDGDEGSILSQVARDECSPNSDVYISTITNRQNRVDDGRSWLIVPKALQKSSNNKTKGDETAKEGSGGKDKTNGMSPVEKAHIPMNGSRQICLANLSARGCRRQENCGYLHEEAAVPPELAGYFQKRFGAAKN